MKAVLWDSWVAGMCVRLICRQWRHVKPLRSSDESDDALYLKTVCLTAGRVPRSAKVWLGLNGCVCVHPRKCATLHTQFINSPNVCGAGICQECDSNISHLLSLLPAFYSPLHTLFQPCWCLLQSVFVSLSPFWFSFKFYRQPLSLSSICTEEYEFFGTHTLKAHQSIEDENLSMCLRDKWELTHQISTLSTLYFHHVTDSLNGNEDNIKCWASITNWYLGSLFNKAPVSENL